jgi:ComF family protein
VLQRALRNIRDGLLGLAYPEECRVCGGAVESWDDGVACAQCWDNPALTKILIGCVCSKCGAPVAPTTSNAQSPFPAAAGRLCGMCSSAPFTAARACGVYSGALEASILFLKVTPHICPRLRAIIKHTFSEHHIALRSDVVMPVPLHRLRQKQRGFNQAAIVARLISREFGLRLDDRSVMRIKPTERHRAGMDANDRSQSVERAFEVTRRSLIAGASVLLVDDVYTTGSTISAATQSLIDAGVQQVNVLTIARVGER